MPLYIPWLSETIKKRGVRYLLHHYLGHFFDEKLTLEQLSVDIYEGKGSIKDLALDVDGLNDELDFVPFKFLEGCSIGQISVEVPWSSLSTDACRVELEGAKFICRRKNEVDMCKTSCNESTLLTRSLMTSSMQMAEEIVTTEDDDDFDSPSSSHYRMRPSRDERNDCKEEAHSHLGDQQFNQDLGMKDANSNEGNKMFEGLEMFAQLIDSVLRRTKLTAFNTTFQIQASPRINEQDTTTKTSQEDSMSNSNTSNISSNSDRPPNYSANSNDKFSKIPTVEYHVRYFRCEEILVETNDIPTPPVPDTTGNQRKDFIRGGTQSTENKQNKPNGSTKQLPEMIEKLLTLEDIEMRIDGKPVSNLIGRHTIRIKFDGQKSDMHIYLGSPLLAVISSQQLNTFLHVFNDSNINQDVDAMSKDGMQKVMRSEDYAKIETQLLQMESAGAMKCFNRGYNGEDSFNPEFTSPSSLTSGRRWTVGNVGSLNSGQTQFWPIRQQPVSRNDIDSSNQASTSVINTESIGPKKIGENVYSDLNRLSQPTTAGKRQNTFNCEFKIPGIWLCILKSNEESSKLISPYADSTSSFANINKFLDRHVKVPHIRALALRVSLNVSSFLDAFLGDIQVTEYVSGPSNEVNSKIPIILSDTSGHLVESSRYHISSKHKELTIDLLTKTKITIDPTLIDRLMSDYGLKDLFEELAYSNDCHPSNQNQTVELGSSASKAQTLLSTSSSYGTGNLNVVVTGEQIKLELLCPIPDLRSEADEAQTQLRPESFIINLNSFMLSWYSGKLNVTARRLQVAMKYSPNQNDSEAIRFLDSMCNAGEKISLTLEPSPSNLDKDFPDDEVENALNEASMYDSIYVGQATESKIPTEVFQTKRKVVRGNSSKSKDSENENECDSEKIISPGDRQHLLDYLDRTFMSTKLSLNLYLPRCEMEFQDKNQLEIVYNRLGNDFVFWKPNVLKKQTSGVSSKGKTAFMSRTRSKTFTHDVGMAINAPGLAAASYFSCRPTMNESSSESEVSFHSLSLDNNSDIYHNEATCKITVGDLKIRFNQQENEYTSVQHEAQGHKVLLGVVLDLRGKPCTIICLALDNFELKANSINVLEGNFYGDKNSKLGLAVEIKRPSSMLKEIKFSARLMNTIFRDFDMDTYKKLWKTINLTDEDVLGYVPPRIVTEVHLDIVNTALSLVKDGVRPSLITMDELYVTSMVVAKTSQVMLRLIADEASLYLKRNKQGLETLKNYICVIDSGLIDLNVKFSDDGRIEFGLTNNVITTRVCQDSLFALFQLIDSVTKSKKMENEHSQCDANTSNLSHFGTSSQCSSPEVGNVERSCSSPEPPFHNGVPLNGEFIPGLDYRNEMNTSTKSEVTLLQDAIDDLGSTDYDSTEQINCNSVKVKSDQDDLARDIFGGPLTSSANQDSCSMMSGSRDLNTSSLSRGTIEESGFFILGDDDVGAGIIDNKMSEPVVRQLIETPVKIIENHFNLTKPKTLPDMLASTLERYVLEEMSLIINLFGGRDFDDDESATHHDAKINESSSNKPNLTPRKTTNLIEESYHIRNPSERSPKKSGRRKYASESSDHTLTSEPRVRFGDGAVNLWESLDLMSSPDILTHRSNHPVPNADFKNQGGPWRQNDVCVQFCLSKVKFLYEICDHDGPFAWRFLLHIQEIEVKDKLAASNINKMLYEYSTGTMPKRNNTDMLSIKLIATKNPTDNCEECDLKISVKPLRLNIDQDTLIFLVEFFSACSTSISKSSNKTNQAFTDGKLDSDKISDLRTTTTTVGQEYDNQRTNSDRKGINIRQRQVSESSDASFSFGSSSPSPPSLSRSSSISLPSTNTTIMLQCNTGNAVQPLYIKSFSFSPDLPIRLDYHGKRVDFEQVS